MLERNIAYKAKWIFGSGYMSNSIYALQKVIQIVLEKTTTSNYVIFKF